MRHLLGLGMLAALLLVVSPVVAADVADRRATPAPAPASWNCGMWSRVTNGLLYDTPGFFGNKGVGATILVGCGQPNGGFDFDVVGVTPFNHFDTANEFDLEGGYTVVFSNFRVRLGGAYWNVQPAPGPRFQIVAFQIKPSYTLVSNKSLTLTAWTRLEDQELFTPTAHLRDVNVSGGLNFEVPFGGLAKLAGEAAHYYHVKSFGPAQHVTALTLEMPFNLPRGLAGMPGNVEMTIGPWWRGTLGNINGPAGNQEFNNSIGGKFTANWK